MKLFAILLFVVGFSPKGFSQKIVEASDGGYFIRNEKIKANNRITKSKTEFIFETSYVEGNFEFHLMSSKKESPLYIIKPDSSIHFILENNDTCKAKIFKPILANSLFLVFHIDSLNAVSFTKEL